VKEFGDVILLTGFVRKRFRCRLGISIFGRKKG
jgi:hypothetical protein